MYVYIYVYIYISITRMCIYTYVYIYMSIYIYIYKEHRNVHNQLKPWLPICGSPFNRAFKEAELGIAATQRWNLH